MKKKNNLIYVVLVLSMVLGYLNCERDTPLLTQAEYTGDIALHVSFENPLQQVKTRTGQLRKAMLTITTGKVTVSASDMQTIVKSLTISATSFSGQVNAVPVGEDRQVSIELYDENNDLIYQGSNTTSVAAGKTSNVDITLTAQQGILKDIDGNFYSTVLIGNKWWMGEDLRVQHYRNGTAIPVVSDNASWSGAESGACCYYSNSSSLASVYGLLYNGYALTDSRNLAPSGWHVPTDDDWKALETALGMSSLDVNNFGVRGSDEGGQLKETGTSHWSGSNSGATNSTGFTGRPGGYRNDFDGSYNGKGSYAFYWTTSEYNGSETYNWARRLNYDDAQIYRFGYHIRSGFSVRLVSD